jgi:ABC-type uncharacterized transport system substrate-binding protein
MWAAAVGWAKAYFRRAHPYCVRCRDEWWARRRPRIRAPGSFAYPTVLLIAAVLTTFPGMNPASAHPHVWVVAASELIYAPDGTISGVRHAWTFDDMFSTYALQGIESKTKGVYTSEELAPLAQTNVESLKEFGFFTFAKADGKKEKFLEPVDYFLEQKNGALVLHFTLPFKTPFKTKALALEIYDPSFFVDFSLAKQDPVRLVGAPAACSFAIQRPNDGTAGAQKLNEQTFMNGENSNYGAMFANKITVDCP